MNNRSFDLVELYQRQSNLRQALRDNRIDLAVITSWENLYYFLGILTMQSRNRVVDPMPLVVSPDLDDVIFIPTDMFSSSIELEHPHIKNYYPYSGPHPWSVLYQIVTSISTKPRTIALEYRGLTVHHHEILKKLFPDAKFVDCSPITNELRMIKSASELNYIRQSCEIVDKVLETRPSELLKPAKTEMEIAGEIIRDMISLGAEGPSFYPQVVSGYRSSLLNISSSCKRIERGEIVILDFGAIYRGYCSDTARPFVVKGKLTDEQKKSCDAALRITLTALDAVQPGINAKRIYEVAVSEARKLGYLNHIRHGSGHGIGLEVWEPPLLTDYGETILKEGMTLAVEQGVYMGSYGFRFEQNVVVTKNGCEPLFKHAMELHEL